MTVQHISDKKFWQPAGANTPYRTKCGLPDDRYGSAGLNAPMCPHCVRNTPGWTGARE